MQVIAYTAILFVFIDLIECHSSVPVQRFDGYFNNEQRPEIGSVGRHLRRNITTKYADYTYYPSGSERPNPRGTSNIVFKGVGRSHSHHRRSALFAFFGQLVMREVTDTDDISCPVEVINTPVPRCDPDFDPNCRGDQVMPYERVAYDKKTGQSPNNPRKQINKASSFIDGGFVYGTNTVRSSFLRSPGSGKLYCEDIWGRFPKLNDVELPYSTFPAADQKMKDQSKFWRLGDSHIYENPALLSLGLVFFRYHNYKADQIMTNEPRLSNNEIFDKSRRWVIASLQKIILYDWLPLLLNEPIQPYTGYKPSVESEVTDLFDAAAIHYIFTLIPSAIHQRTKKCEYMSHHKIRRLCNTYWDSQDILYQRPDGLEEILMGLTSQLAEKEDHILVEDLRSKYYGPLFYSRHDAATLTIMKGRDYGLPDYNTALQSMGLEPIKTWEEINPTLNQSFIDDIKMLHNGHLDRIDIYTGGMLETTSDGPGPLFRLILLDQFLRLRDGDRFWFENKDNGIFTDDEIDEIYNITLNDIIIHTTDIEEIDLQDDAFTVSINHSCKPPKGFDEKKLAKCPDHKGYDYFAGSEIPYIIIWTCMGFIPIACILVAVILAKYKKWSHQQNVEEVKHEKERKRVLRRTLSSSISVHDMCEWRCKKEPSRCIEVHLTSKGTLEIFSSTGSHLRTIKINNIGRLKLYQSINKKRNILLIHIAKEYDLVLVFSTEIHRNKFEQELSEFLESFAIETEIFEKKLKDIYAMAMTKEKRNLQLEKFFKTVFTEAFQMDYDPSLDEVQLNMKTQSKDILECELSKEEFAEALAVKANSDFIDHFFYLIDSDRNGYISFREFLHAVVLFSKGSCQDKLQTMFYMYDLDSSGRLSKDEISKMFRSLLELAQSNLEKDEIEQLVESLCVQSGLGHQDEFQFEDFCQILSPQMDKLWNASIDWKGCKSCLPTQPKTNTRKNSEADIKQRRPSLNTPLERDNSPSFLNFVSVREPYTPVKAKIKLVKHFIENYRQHIYIMVLFYGIVAGLFAERFYYYSVQREHSGFMKLMSYGISVTRGAAAAMSFTFSLLMLTMCRNTITYLRSTFLNVFIPFDSHISFHKIVAWTALFFSALHVFGYSFNFYHLATQPTKFLCIFESIVFRADTIPTFSFWLFENMTGFTGVLLVVVLCIMYIFATQTARRHIFSLFWTTHKLFVIMYVLVILHGASIIVQKPLFYAYFVGPAILFTFDKMVSISRKKMEINIVKAINLPSDVTMLEFKRPPRFEYKSGQWVRIACLSHGKNEYHPFTLTSAPHEDTLKVHIRALGPWTWNIRQIFDSENLKGNPYPKLYLDGPYGAGQQDWYQYDVSLLVGAGIGVTPYASILKDFVHMTSIKNTYKVKCQKLYFIWVTGSQRHFEWLIDILREVEEVDTRGLVSIDIFITQFFQNFDLRTAMLYIFEEHFQKMTGGKSVYTGLKATTHFGRPQLNKMMQAVHRAHPQARKVGVFSCGPPGVTKGVERACVDASKTTKALFEHHYENF
ncbi:dual oxidase 2 [Patella vulgata]|uniref:dual oxidase 2 n=1 Tax=Patella vulgata TaxID=6465 RepID=UPI0021806980|nr:dual oxidase 2 [Patella vulgata]XP_050407077.1 dual oxidase 2 [Patella vulgata]XP_050407078.1 dual oxidase 2 [Patella vulgata]